MKPKKVCEVCKAEFRPQSRSAGRFCNRDCMMKGMGWKPNNHSCMCCSKAFKVRGGNRKSLYCSRQCAKRYLSWDRNRKARCKCGKATGKSRSLCVDCKIVRRNPVPEEWRECIKAAYSTMRPTTYTPLQVRCNNTAVGLYLRSKEAPRMHRRGKGQRPKNLDRKILMEMDRMKQKGKAADRSPLETKCHSVASGLRKRGRRRRASS